MKSALMTTKGLIPGMEPVSVGKVREMYDFGDLLLMVATDRISAFDWVMPTGIPDKGRVLTMMSEKWFLSLATPHHLISTDPGDVLLPHAADMGALRGRSMVVRKATVFPVECVVRGYLSGSGWKDYKKNHSVCGVPLPMDMEESDLIAGGPIFTPATKEKDGHDINIPFSRMVEIVGQEKAEILMLRTLQIYCKGAERARRNGIILADTKFEFGEIDGEIILIDEVLTPDSSRFWPADEYEAGRPQNSFDKQFVRDWLETVGWDKNSPPPELPPDIVDKTRAKYVEAYERLTGKNFIY